jgi:hypothetical protein
MTSKDTAPMLDENELRSALEDAAERFAVPAGGIDAVRTAARTRVASPGEPAPREAPGAGRDRSGSSRRVLIGLGGIAAAIVLALLVSSIARTGRTATSSNTSSAGSASGVPTSAPESAIGGKEKSSLTTTTPASGSGADATASASGSSAGSLRQPGATRSSGLPTARSATKADAGSEKIVKTGSIDLLVPRRTFSDRVNRLTGIAKGLGGFVAETSTSEQDVTPTGTIALRVPADHFEELLVQARRLGKVRSATSAAKDVTSEYTDIAGRLKTMTDERNSLGLVLSDAKNVPDILAVRDRLNVVQAEIEQLQGRRNVLDDQTALATLTVSLHEPTTAAPVPHPSTDDSGLSGAWRRAVDGFTGGVESIVAGSGKVLLVVLCATVAWTLGRPIWHRFRRALV